MHERSPHLEVTLGENESIKFAPGTLIEVVGNVGAGKTTLANRLLSSTNLQYVNLDLFEQNPFLPLVTKDPARWAFTNAAYFSLIRSRQIDPLKTQLETDAVIMDQGFHMPYYMYTRNRQRQGQMSKYESQVIDELHFKLMKDAPLPTLTIALLHPVDELLRRIGERGRLGARSHESSYSAEFLENLNKGLYEYLQYLEKQGSLVIRHEGNNHPLHSSSEVDTKIMRAIDKALL